MKWYIKPMEVTRKVITGGTTRASISSEIQGKRSSTRSYFPELFSIRKSYFAIDMHHLNNFACLGEIELSHFKLA